MEKEANEFASALLMPKAEIAAAFRVRRLDMARLAALKPEWRVSMQLRTRDLLMRGVRGRLPIALALPVSLSRAN